MLDIIKREKDFFSKIQADLSNDFIRLNKSFVPKRLSNKVNRFYMEDNSFWFARLKINDGNVLYYFGRKIEDNDNVIPELILKFNSDSNKSSIRFNKNKFLVRIKHSDNDYIINLKKHLKEISNELSIVTNDNLKKKGFYYLVFNNSNFLNNLKKVLDLVKFNVNFEKNYLTINQDENNSLNKVIQDNTVKSEVNISNENFSSSISKNSEGMDDLIDNKDLSVEKNLSLSKNNTIGFKNEKSSHLTILKRNTKIFKCVKFINNLDLDIELKNNMTDYLFIKNQENNYNLSDNMLKFSIPFDETMSLIYDILKDCENSINTNHLVTFNTFRKRITISIKRYYAKIEFPDENKEYNELFKDEISNYLLEHFNDSNTKNVENQVNIEKNERELKNNPEVLFEKFLKLKETPKFKFNLIPLYNISDDDLIIILDTIKRDIMDNKLNDEMSVENIFEEYIKNQDSINKFNSLMEQFTEYVSGNEFDELLNEYNTLSSSDVDDVINKVRLDIESNNIHKSDIDVRFRRYFSYKLNEINFLNDLELIDTQDYEKKGLENSEINDVFNIIQQKIKNWHDDPLIFDEDLETRITDLFNEKENQIRKDSRHKFDKLFPNKNSIKKVLNMKILREEDYLSLKNYIYKDIQSLRIRSNDITENLLVEYYNSYLS